MSPSTNPTKKRKGSRLRNRWFQPPSGFPPEQQLSLGWSRACPAPPHKLVTGSKPYSMNRLSLADRRLLLGARRSRARFCPPSRRAILTIPATCESPWRASRLAESRLSCRVPAFPCEANPTRNITGRLVARLRPARPLSERQPAARTRRSAEPSAGRGVPGSLLLMVRRTWVLALNGV